MIVIAILGLISSVSLLSVRTPLRAVRFSNDVEKILALDGQARTRAGKGHSARLQINARDDSIALVSTTTRRAQLSTRDIIQSIHSDQDERDEDGNYLIRFGARGTSASYAIELASPRGNTTWLVVMGLTGESYILNEPEWSHAQISKLLAPRPNAD